MKAFEKLRDYGFKLTEEFILKELEELGPFCDIETAKKRCLSTDLRKHLLPYFPADLSVNPNASLSLPGPVVFQIVSVSNSAVPSKRKYEESHPRLLSIVLTDGQQKITGIELESISGLSATTSPGGKLLFHGGEFFRAKLLLQNRNCVFLGGLVESLAEAHAANLNALRFRDLEKSMGSRNVSKDAMLKKTKKDAPPSFNFNLPVAASTTGNVPLKTAATSTNTTADTTIDTTIDTLPAKENNQKQVSKLPNNNNNNHNNNHNNHNNNNNQRSVATIHPKQLEDENNNNRFESHHNNSNNNSLNNNHYNNRKSPNVTNTTNNSNNNIDNANRRNDTNSTSNHISNNNRSKTNHRTEQSIATITEITTATSLLSSAT
jgi:hypothetical protein